MSKVIRSAALLLLAGTGLGGLAAAQTADDLHIVRHSSFESPGNARDPFLPVGWQKPETGAMVPAGNGKGARTVESYIVRSAFVVSSISLDRLPLAVINGKTYGEGDTLPFVAGGDKIQLQVSAIRDGAVTLRYKTFQVTCPIRIGQTPLKPALPPP